MAHRRTCAPSPRAPSSRSGQAARVRAHDRFAITTASGRVLCRERSRSGVGVAVAPMPRRGLLLLLLRPLLVRAHVPGYGCTENCCKPPHPPTVSQAFYVRAKPGAPAAPPSAAPPATPRAHASLQARSRGSSTTCSPTACRLTSLAARPSTGTRSSRRRARAPQPVTTARRVSRLTPSSHFEIRAGV